MGVWVWVWVWVSVFSVWGLGFRVECVEFGVKGFVVSVSCPGSMVLVSGCGVEGVEFQVHSLWCMI